MFFRVIVIALFALLAAVVNSQNVDVTANTTLSCGYKATCSAGGYEGACVSISAGCCSGGTTTSNLCPGRPNSTANLFCNIYLFYFWAVIVPISGSSDIKCCTAHSCSTPSGSGTCMSTSQCGSKGGHSVAGYCTGPVDLQCCVGGPGPTPSGKISRDEIISRAQNWVDRRIPYSQTATTGMEVVHVLFSAPILIVSVNLKVAPHITVLFECTSSPMYFMYIRRATLIADGYRQDCSGMVSMAWKSSTSGGGHTTYNMQNICTKISRSELKKGDVLLKPSEHVLMFDHWVDSDHFMEYAEHTYGQVASHDQTSYSYHANDGFFPCRYNSVA